VTCASWDFSPPNEGQESCHARLLGEDRRHGIVIEAAGGVEQTEQHW
jgi:hypothetical protein